MKKICPECGSEIKEGAIECGNCGYPLEPQETNEDKNIIDNDVEYFSDNSDTTLSNPYNKKIEDYVSQKKAIVIKDNKILIVLMGIIGVLVAVVLFLSVKTSALNKKIDEYQVKLDKSDEENKKLSDMISVTESDYKKVQEEYGQIKDEYEVLKTEYTQYKEEMKPYEEMEEAEAKQRKSEAEAQQKEKENQQIATEAVKKVWNFESGELQNGATRDLCADAKTKVNALSDEAVKQSLLEAIDAAEQTITAQENAAAEEKARGYETGITYDQLARTPDDYNGKKCKFSGKVLQVMESDNIVGIRLAVNSNYNTVLYCMFSQSIISSRILEDDIITVYGTSSGIYTYESTMRASISIPSMIVDKVDQ